MRSFPPLMTGRRLPEQPLARFSWLGDMVVPLAVGVMEAQFGVLAFVFGALLFTDKSEPMPLIEVGIILVWWSMYWWALIVKRGIQPRFGERYANLAYFLALFVIFTPLIGMHPAFVESVPEIICVSILSLVFWRRGMARVEKGSQEELLPVIFQVGFGTLLCFMLIVVVYPPFSQAILFDALRTIVPLFCLSGFAALSLSYLRAMYSGQSARSGSRVQFTRTGVLLLFFLAAIAALTMILSVTAFVPLEALFAPLLDKARELYSWLLSLLFARPVEILRHARRLQMPGIDVIPEKHGPFSHLVEESLTLLLIIGLALLALVVLIAVVWIILSI